MRIANLCKLCLTLCDAMDCSPPVFSVSGILQARILKGIAIPSPGDLFSSGIKPGCPALQAESLLSEPLGKPSFHHLQEVYFSVLSLSVLLLH